MRSKALAAGRLLACSLSLSATLVAASASEAVSTQGLPAAASRHFDFAPLDSTHTGSFLSGVTSVTSRDAWAVGERDAPGEEVSLILHYNGEGWSIMYSPNPGGRYGTSLASVDAVSANDVWAVGEYGSRRAGSHALILHWNGNVWRRVASPDFGDTQLLSVSAVSRNDIWTVGYGDPSGSGVPRAFAFHWNGTAWSRVTTPDPKGSQRPLYGVSATGTTSAWTVGATVPRRAPTVAKTLAEHWNGQAWHQVATPSPGGFLNVLLAVTVVAPGDAWAVGEFANRHRGASFPLLEHVVAGHWVRPPIPRLGPGSTLLGVSGDAPDDVWAVGRAGGQQAVMLHWDGTDWHRYTGPGAAGTVISSVTTHGSVATFAVGARLLKGHWIAVQEQWNGRAWIR